MKVELELRAKLEGVDSTTMILDTALLKKERGVVMGLLGRQDLTEEVKDQLEGVDAILDFLADYLVDLAGVPAEEVFFQDADFE